MNTYVVLAICVLVFILSIVISCILFSYRAQKNALNARLNYFKEKNDTKEKMSISFSKKMLIIFSVNSLVLTAMTIVLSFTHYDPTALSVVTAASYCVDGTWGGFYLWKSKNENRAKYAQQFVRDFANEYGIDAAIRIAEVVLKE